MNKKTLFASLRKILVPVVYGRADESAIKLAELLAPEVVLVGVVCLPADGSLSAGASKAQELRRLLRKLGRGHQVRARSQVLVTTTPWQDLQPVIEAEAPDLLLLDSDGHLTSLGTPAEEVLSHPACDVGLLRGPLSSVERVLVPVRGGPSAELALRIGLNLSPRELYALHIQLAGDSAASNAPFKAIERVLQRMPEVQLRSIVTADTAKTIVEQTKAIAADLVILGASARAGQTGAALGPVAEYVLAQISAAVLVVKTRRPLPASFADERVSAGAISLLVDKWFAQNTFQADEFADLHHLVDLKQQQGLTISLALPALNEEATVGKVIRTVKQALMDKVPLLDEIVLIDSNSTDRTRQIAEKAGIPVYIHQELLPAYGARNGKGEALWKSLFVTRGDLIIWIDTDIVNIHPRFVYGIIGPMLINPEIQFVKGFYRRPLRVGDKLQAGGGGRVTELTARPLINLFYPELSGVIQPLSGEYGGRRTALERCAFSSGYGVETSLLIDIYELFGLSAIAQVDLLERIHHNQSLEALSKMSFAIIQTVMRKLERHYERAFIADVNKTMKLIRYQAGGYYLELEEIAELERPPMIEIPEYLASRPALTRSEDA
jgi:glycosyltransferase involved in cell wall biosynthesis/nucleotide-binding universal stress UspA family protein